MILRLVLVFISILLIFYFFMKIVADDHFTVGEKVLLMIPTIVVPPVGFIIYLIWRKKRTS